MNKQPNPLLAVDYGPCVFCHQPIHEADDKVIYGHDYYTKAQAYAHWDCYHEALNARIGADRG